MCVLSPGDSWDRLHHPSQPHQALSILPYQDIYFTLFSVLFCATKKRGKRQLLYILNINGVKGSELDWSLVLAVQYSHSRPAGALTGSQLEKNVIFMHFVVCSELTFHRYERTRVCLDVGAHYLLTDFSLDWCPVAHVTISL